jgi:DNA-binding NarL/FixJ family response regulator
VAGGASNQAIAEQFVLSIKTVERHIANLYAKIGAHGRVDATTFAHRHHLL